MYGKGIHRTGEILELGVKEGIVEKSGRLVCLQIRPHRAGVARMPRIFLDQHPEMREEIDQTIRAALMPALDAPRASDAESAEGAPFQQ